MMDPVMYRAMSEARKTIAFAISSGGATYPRGIPTELPPAKETVGKLVKG